MPESAIELTPRPSDDEPTVDLTIVGFDEIPDGGVFWATEVGGTTRLFNGHWVDAHQLKHVFDGDVYVRLTPSGSDVIDAEILLAHNGKMRPGGCWSQLGPGWAEVLLDPVETLMSLHLDLEESVQCLQSVPSGDQD